MGRMEILELNEEERKHFDLMIADLRTIFKMEEIPGEDIPDVLSELKSDEVKAYIEALKQGSKPESALREAFFAGRSLLSKYLGGKSAPEVKIGTGFIDYVLRLDDRSILIELKSLFESSFETGKVRRLKKLRKKELNYELYKEQVLKYIKEGVEYIILSDLENWYFFNKQTTYKDFKYFYKTDFFQLIEEYGIVGDFWDFIRRKDYQVVRENLDKRFFESLKIWVEKLSEVVFDVDDKIKIEQIIRLINKFIFIQTLDDFYVIDARWIKTNWDEIERKWKAKGELQVLIKYFEEVDEWFYEYYDTELFRENVLQHIIKDGENIKKLYKILQIVLGVTGWQTTFRGIAGIMQYNFRFIDEDIFGKAYETFLADVRHDEGIYYTPKYITEYIVDTTVGRTFDELLSEIKIACEVDDFEHLEQLLKRLMSIKVLDPACGSGSFLVKAVRKIMYNYRKVNDLLNNKLKKLNVYNHSMVRSKNIDEKVIKIQNLITMIKTEKKLDLISRLIIRHIHGNDLDRKALEVAKVNMWLESIKLAPKEFRFDKLPSYTKHVLPNLEMNLVNGDSVVGLPNQVVIDYMILEHLDDLQELSKLRNEYLEETTNPEFVEKIMEIKESIRKGLDEKFKEYIKTIEVSDNIIIDTKPFYWPLELWHMYFVDGIPLEEKDRGSDIVVGNPPYERIQVLNKKSPETVDFLNKAGFNASTGNYDLAVLFIEKGISLLKSKGKFGYIISNKFMKADYGVGIRELISKNKYIYKMVDFNDQQVFVGATTYTSLLFIGKEKHDFFNYAKIKKLEENIDQLRSIDYKTTNDTIIAYKISNDSISEKPWLFISETERKIMKKIDHNPMLSTICKDMFVGIQTSADSVYVVRPIEEMNGLAKIFSKEKSKEYVLEKELLKPFFHGRDITKWSLGKAPNLLIFPYTLKKGVCLLSQSYFSDNYPKTWDYLVDCKEKLESRERGKIKGKEDWYGYVYLKNMDKFVQNKIIVQVLSNRASCSLDLDGNYYFAGAGGSNCYGITLKEDQEISLPYLCGLLNSSLLDWYVKKISSIYKGGYYIYAKRYLEKLPIKIETDDEKQLGSQIGSIVNEILDIKKKKYYQLRIWEEVSERLSNSNQTLFKTLELDEQYNRDGDFDSSWTSKASFYPSSNNEKFETDYNVFSIIFDSENLTIKIYGLTDDGKEELIIEITFNNIELMSHVYNCLKTTLSSRLRIKSLKQLLDKTKIPVIKPFLAQNTVNIIKKMRDESDNADLTIGEIDDSIIKYEAQIDAIVFELYGLSTREANTVMNSLDLPASYQQLITLEHKKYKK